MSVTINITGDVFLGRRLEPIARNNPKSLFGKGILNLFHHSDFNILNLESPLTNAGKEHELLKTGPNLKASPETIGALTTLKTNLVTLANNHIYDYGNRGLSDTLELCKQQNIDTVGAGLTFEGARKVFYKKFDSISVAVVNIAENEWCNANEKRGGANPMNIIATVKSIQEAKKSADIILLIIHGGHEYYHFPSPRMVEQYRFYAEQGASIIIGHHSHYLSGYEIFKGVPIFYGLGNFLFDAEKVPKEWEEGLILNIQINERKEILWSAYPYKQCSGLLKVELLEGIEKLNVENKISAINTIIADPEKLKEKFNQFIEKRQKDVLSVFSTSYILKYKYLRSAIKKLRLERFFLRREQLKSILNYTRCEAHRDITLEVIDHYINSNMH